MDESKPPFPSDELNLRPASEAQSAVVDAPPYPPELCRDDPPNGPSVVVFCGNEKEVSRGFHVALRAMGVTVFEQAHDPAKPPVPRAKPHGMDINHRANLLYVACDGGLLVEVDARSGQPRRQWPLAGVPDATFFNPISGLVHVAIEDPGLVQTIDPLSGTSTQFMTANGAKTAALIEPDRLYVFSPLHKGVLDLKGA
jgi:hypothetical protein